MNLPSEPREEAIVAVMDSREQLPLDLGALKVETKALAAGDYSVKGLEEVIAIERKSLNDFVRCCSGADRERMEKQVRRLLSYPVRAIVLEADWADIECRNWPAISRVEPRHVRGTILGICALGVPVIMAGNHRRAGELTARLLFIAARRRYREAKGLLETVGGGEERTGKK